MQNALSTRLSKVKISSPAINAPVTNIKDGDVVTASVLHRYNIDLTGANMVTLKVTCGRRTLEENVQFEPNESNESRKSRLTDVRCELMRANAQITAQRNAPIFVRNMIVRNDKNQMKRTRELGEKTLTKYAEPTLRARRTDINNSINNIVVESLRDAGYNDYIPPAPVKELCAICHDDIDPVEGKKNPCGHVFHLHCLEQWFETGHLSCPTCRVEVTEDPRVEEVDE